MLGWKTMLAAAVLVVGAATIDAQQARNAPGNQQQKERAQQKVKEGLRKGDQNAQEKRVEKKAEQADRKDATPERAKAKAREAAQTGKEVPKRAPTRAQLNQHFSELAREVQLNRRHVAKLDRFRDLAKKKDDKARLKQIADLVDRETDRHSRIALALQEKMGEKHFAMAMKRLKADLTNVKRQRVVGEGKKP